MLERWSEGTLRDGNNPQICIVAAHLALLIQNFEYSDLDERTVRLHICSQVNLMSRHSFLSDPLRRERGRVSVQQSKGSMYELYTHTATHSHTLTSPLFLPYTISPLLSPSLSSSSQSRFLRDLQVPETEVFSLFQTQRTKILQWMESHPMERGRVLEGVVTALTRTGSVSKVGEGEGEREWRSLLGRNCGGRYVPAASALSRKMHPLSVENEEVCWLLLSSSYWYIFIFSLLCYHFVLAYAPNRLCYLCRFPPTLKSISNSVHSPFARVT